jgi:Flp pilus assembly pilin Flp
MLRRIGDILRREEAATAVEYAVMLALIIVTAIGAINLLGSQTSQLWGSNNTALESVGFGS